MLANLRGMGPRRLLPLFFAVIFLITLLFYYSANVKDTWQSGSQKIAEHVGLGDWSWQDAATEAETEALHKDDWKQKILPGVPKAPGSNYTKVLVIPKIKKEDIGWMDKEIPDVQRVVYVADDPEAPLHPPANKGHEAMVYLTYIIDNYDNLPDIMLFMHAHQRAWHNNDVFNSDAAEIVRRLSPEHVIRNGYMNLRCHWYPGCPDWMHPGNVDFDQYKSEQVLIAKAWAEIFPMDPVPDVLAQPCCSQFALSKDRIRQIPKEKFEFYRHWLLTTKLKDFISGRVWEYMWQYAFTGQNYWCPVEHVCYCDGYGVCFGGEPNYKRFMDLRKKRDRANVDLVKWQEADKKLKEAVEQGKPEEEIAKMPVPKEGKDHELWAVIKDSQAEMDQISDEAKERGKDPKARAEEAGRPWKEGDGY